MLYKSPQVYVTADGQLTADPGLGDLPPSLGGLACEWMSTNLVFGPGDLAGKPYEVPDHFVEPLYRIYEYHPLTGRRVVSRVLIGIGKGNSKTEFAAAVANFEFAGPCVLEGTQPELRADPSVVMGAASYEQADLIYGAFREMSTPIHDLYDGPYDRETFRKDMPGKAERVAAKAGTNDGKRPTCVIADEFHEWTGNIGRNHLVLTNGLAKRRDSLELNITTAGARQDDSACLRMYEYGKQVASGEIWDPSFLFFWWEMPDTVDYSDTDKLGAALVESNPASWVDLARLVKRASEIPEFEHRRYHGNQWTQTADSWMTETAWNRRHDPHRTVTNEPVVLFFDGSYTNDSAAIVAVTVDSPHHVFVVDVWENPAFLMDQPNNDGWRIGDDEIDTAMSNAMETYNVKQLWYDPWGYHKLGRSWTERWGEDTVGEHNTRQIGAVVAPACSMMYTAVHSDTADVQISHDGNATLRRHIGNAITKETPDGMYIVKDGTHSPRKIDAAYAATMGLWYASNHAEDDKIFRGSAIIT